MTKMGSAMFPSNESRAAQRDDVPCPVMNAANGIRKGLEEAVA
jgi:hypothetical protein